jgi:outer membrane protein assembly factor BamB
VGDGRVFGLGTEGDLVAVAIATGKELWRRNILRDFGGEVMAVADEGKSYSWKVSESPLLDGDRLIVTPGSKDALLVALEVATGKEIWRTKVDRDLGPLGDDGTAYSSAVASNAAGVRQIVQLVGRGLVGVDAASGKLLWHYNKVANNVANIPTPLVVGDLVFASTGYQTGAALLEIGTSPEGRIEARERYFLPAATFQNHHGNMVVHDGHIYAGTGHNRGYPIALELGTGKVAWGPASNSGTGSAAVVWAENRLYMRYQNGVMVLVETTPAGYREAGSFTIPNVVRQSWSHPVIAGGVLYLREQDTLHAYDLRRPAAP